MSAMVFDLDDLCDEFDPYDALLSLKEKYPGLRVTLFAIPGRCSDGLLARYRALDWVELGVHGYWHSSIESSAWGYDETVGKMTEVSNMGWPKLFKPPGWIANDYVYDALGDMGWRVMAHKDYIHNWVRCPAKMYVFNDRPDVASIHGHTWDTCGNGPSNWEEMFAEVPQDAEFKFVSEVCRSRSYMEVLDLDIKPGELFVDIGAFIGEEIQSCVDRGVRVESYEPTSKWYDKLEKRWGAHPLVTVHNLAVSNRYGTAPMYLPEVGSWDSGSSLHGLKSGASLYMSEVVSLIDAAEVVKDKDIAVLKIDAEGEEWVILERILDTVGFDRIGQVFIEDHTGRIESDDWEEHRLKVKARLEEAGVQIGGWV